MGDREHDPYRVLGIGAEATAADIARAYRRLARAMHPDSRPGDPAAAGQFRALAEAYGVLSDPARRAAWDHRHPRQPDPRAAAPRPASPDLWPLPPTVHPAHPPRPPASPLHGAALRAGPVRIEPPARSGRGQQQIPYNDAVRARLLYWLVAGLEQPW
jgi:curved DNA-binding protein CbpA